MNKFFFFVCFIMVGVYANDPFEIPNFPNALDEGILYNFDLKYLLDVDDDHTYTCQLMGESSHPSQNVIVTPAQFSLSPSQKVIQITIKVEEDSNCDQGDQLALIVNCKIVLKENPFDEIFIPFTFHADIIDTSTGKMCQDPHIVQNIAGVNEKNVEMRARLCYDIVGKAGDIIEFVGDANLGVTAHFQLRDDFYISKVFIKSVLGMLIISTKDIQGLGDIDLVWREKKDVTLRKGLFVQRIFVEKDSIIVESKNTESVFSVRITRVPVEYKQGFLNIQIEDIGSGKSLLGQSHTGILGYIGNKEYTFVNPVQKDAKSCTLVVNNRLIKAYKENKDSCYSVKLDDILYPRTMNQFQTLKL